MEIPIFLFSKIYVPCVLFINEFFALLFRGDAGAICTAVFWLCVTIALALFGGNKKYGRQAVFLSVFFIFTGIFFTARHFDLAIAIAGSRHKAEQTFTAQDTVFLYVAVSAAKGFLFALASLIVNAVIHLKNKNHKPMAAAFVFGGFGIPFLVANGFLFGLLETLENLHSQNIAVNAFFIYVNVLFKFGIGIVVISFIPFILFAAIQLFRDKRKLLFLSVFFIISGCIAVPTIIDQKHTEDKLNSFDLNADGIFSGKEVTPEQQEWMRKYTHDIPVMLLYAAAALAGFICAVAALIVNETEKHRKKKNCIPPEKSLFLDKGEGGGIIEGNEPKPLQLRKTMRKV